MTALSDPTEAAVPSPGAPSPPLRPWNLGIGPRMAAAFLLIVYFDRLAGQTLVVAGLVPSLLGVMIGAVVAYALLFAPAARLGARSRRGLFDLADGAFGAMGTRRVVAPVVALAHATWFAVALYAGVDLSLRALVSVGLIDSDALSPLVFLGGRSWPGGVFQVAVVAWIVPAAILGPMLVHLVAAVLLLYPIFSIGAMVAALAWLSGDLGAFDGPASGAAEGFGRALGQGARHVIGFAAVAGLAAADWGAASRSERDVTIGGRVGVLITPIAVAALALITVAAALGRPNLMIEPTYSDVLIHRIGGVLGGVLALVHSTALLGPCCFAPTGALAAMRRGWPGAPRRVPTLLLFAASWPLVASGLAGRLELIVPMVGAVVAPVLGVIVAVAGRPSRPGIDPRAMLALSLGLAAGAALLFYGGRPGPWPGPVAGFVVSWLVARLGERNLIPRAGTAPGP
jgi:hypothetical protein